MTKSLNGLALGYRSERRRIAQAGRRALRGLSTFPYRVSSERLHGGERAPTLSPEKCRPLESGVSYSVTHPLGEYMEAHSFLPRFLYELSDVVLDPREGLLYTTNGAVIEESSSWPLQWVRESWPAPPSRLTRRRRSGAAIPLASHSYYHWLIEDLPVALAAHRLLGGSVPLVVDSLSHRFVFDLLRDAMIPYTVVDGPVIMERVSFIGRGPDTGWPHPADVDELRRLAVALRSAGSEQLGSHEPPSSKSVYVSRTRSRRSSNFEVELEERLEAQGVNVVYAEDLTVMQQIQLFAGASTIVGLHGAGLSNMAFLPKGSRVFEVLSTSHMVPCYARLASVCQHWYRGIVYRPEESNEAIVSRVCAAVAQEEAGGI